MSMSTSTSNSQSTPVVTETPENSIIDQISGVASQLASQMNNWAQSVFAQTSAITNQAVGNFFSVSQQMMGLSNNMTSQYNNLFAPENAQLVADANSYNSTARQAVDMGMAGATQAQAGDAALKNSEANLQSYGINPADGRYAALDKAAAVQNAANVAGAENQQRVADTTIGQNLRSQAVQVGAQLPAAIANANNTAIQANTGAANATDANANTGVNLNSLADKYLSTAMGVKLPLSGQKSSSTGNSVSSSPAKSSGPSNSGGGGGGNSGGAGGNSGNGGAAWMPTHGGAQLSSNGGGAARSNPSAGISHPSPDQGNQDDFSDPTGQSYNPLGGIDPNSFSGTGENLFGGGTGSLDLGPQTTPDIFGGDTGTGGASNVFGGNDFGQTFDSGGGPDSTFNNIPDNSNSQFGNISYDPSANQANQWGNTGNTDDMTYEGGNYWTGNGVDPTGGQGDGGVASQDFSQPAPTDWGNGADQYAQSDQQSDDEQDSSDYAAGGAIPGAGPVSPAMSPSGGQQVDDVRAQGPGGAKMNLNAHEFVIPQDVALWKGQEFFQKLIDDSRKRNMMAPAHGKPAGGPPQQNMAPPRFKSRQQLNQGAR